MCAGLEERNSKLDVGSVECMSDRWRVAERGRRGPRDNELPERCPLGSTAGRDLATVLGRETMRT